MEQPSKRQRIAQLSGLKWASDSAVEAVLQRLEDQGALLGAAPSRRTLARAVVEGVQAPTLYGPTLHTIPLDMDDNTTFDWHVVNPFAMLCWLANLSMAFCGFMKRKLLEHPCSPTQPWSIVFYTDEASPGNLLRVDNTRKCHAFYFSFSEFGAEALSKECNCFFAGVLRSKIAAKVKGGLSGVFKSLMQLWFCQDQNFHNTGVTISTKDDGCLMVWATLQHVIADEVALKHLWNVKGAVGIKPCMFCVNVVSGRSTLDGFTGTGIVSTDCLDVGKFVRHTDATLWAAADTLQERAGQLSTAARVELEMVLGMVYDKTTVLYDRCMRQFVKPITITVYDWCHIYLVSGLAQHELYNFLQQARDTYGLQYEQVHQYLRLWTWPKACHSPPKDICNSRRATAHAEKFKAGASETLDFLPVLKHMVRTLGWETGPMKNEVRSLVALCNVLKFLEGQPTGADAAKLDTLIVSHLKLYKVAYPSESENWVPKFHMALHLPALLKKHDCLYAAFTLERKHKTLKKFATTSTIDTGFEKSVLLDLLQDQIGHLEDGSTFQEGTFLINPKPAPESLAASLRSEFPVAGLDFVVAKGACHNQMRTYVGDKVLFDSMAGEQLCHIMLFVQCSAAHMPHAIHALVECYTPVRPSVWRPIPVRSLVSISTMRAATIWCKSSEGICALGA